MMRQILLSIAAFPFFGVGAQHILVRPSLAEPSIIASDPAVSAAESISVLVLNDGGVLTGRIRQVDSRFVVFRDDAEIQVAASDVLFSCGSLEEAYDRRREQIAYPTVERHLALATWCLRFELLPQAARELLDARGLDPKHPRLELLERRLAAASAARLLGRTPKPSQNIGPSHSASREAARPMVTTASFEGHATASNDVIERFTRKVQPILVNNCTVSGCHQIGGQQTFQLDRALLRGLGNRRSTQHNLTATLALVDREQPQLSPLLTVPRQTHGGMRGPIFGARHAAAFSHLLDWVALITRSDVSDEQGHSIETAGYSEPATAVSPGAEQVPAEIPEELEKSDFATLRPAVQYGARLRAWQPKDPFDPQIFNRRHRNRNTADAGSGADVE